MFTLILNLSLHKVISFTCHVLSIFKHAVWKTSLTMQYAKLTIYTLQIEVNFLKLSLNEYALYKEHLLNPQTE